MRSAVQQYGAHPKFTGNCAHKIINIKEIPWIYNQLLKMDKFANQKKNVIFQVVTCPSSWGTLYLFTYLSIYLLLHSWTWIPGSLWRTEAGVSQLNLDSRVTVELRNLPTYLSIYLFIYLPIYLSIRPSIYLSIASQLNLDSRVTVKDWGWGSTVEPGFQGHCGAPQSTYLPIYLSIYLPTYLPTYLSIYPSIYLSIYCFTVEPGFQGHCEGLRLGFHSWTWIPGSLWSSAIYLPTYLSIYLFIYLPIYLSIASQLNLDFRVTVKDWGWGFTVEPGFQGHCGAPQSTYLPIYLSIYLPTYLPIYLSVHLSIYLLLHSWTWIPGSLWRTEAGVSQLNLDSRVTVELRNLPTYLSIYLFIYLPTYLSIYLSVHLSIYLLLHSWTWIPGSLWRTEAGVSQLNLDSRVTVELRNGTWNPGSILLNKEGLEQGPHHSPEKGEPWARAGSGT